jgi:hypothetical protein
MRGAGRRDIIPCKEEFMIKRFGPLVTAGLVVLLVLAACTPQAAAPTDEPEATQEGPAEGGAPSGDEILVGVSLPLTGDFAGLWSAALGGYQVGRDGDRVRRGAGPLRRSTMTMPATMTSLSDHRS